jgi:RNA polymerase sigma-70 factor (ECF subfamily)
MVDSESPSCFFSSGPGHLIELMAASPQAASPRMTSAPERATDEALMELLRQDDALALHELMQRFWLPIIARVSRILDDPDGAADIAQQTFIRLWQQRHRWTSSGGVSAYIFRIARNGALNERRARLAREHAMDRQGRAESAVPPTPLQSLEEHELRDALADALQRLPARRKEVYLLARTGGLSHLEISEMMGISRQTVANQMTAAVAALRRDLSQILDHPG